MKDNGRTYQQNLVMERLCEGLKEIESANDRLEKKATNLVAGSTAAIAAITGVSMFPKSIVDVGRVEAVVLALLCGSVLVMFWFAAKLWGPQPSAVPINYDTDVLYDKYISKTEDVAYNNALIDTSRAFEHCKWVNEIKGKELRHMMFVLQAQVLLLGIGVLLKVFV